MLSLLPPSFNYLLAILKRIQKYKKKKIKVDPYLLSYVFLSKRFLHSRFTHKLDFISYELIIHVLYLLIFNLEVLHFRINTQQKTNKIATIGVNNDIINNKET